MIRRFRCTNCHSYHNELPDCLSPYKHYETEVISGVLDGVVTPEDADSEDYPSMQTIKIEGHKTSENKNKGCDLPPRPREPEKELL